MKLRVPIIRINTNVYAQGGIGGGSIYPVLHYAIGGEYGFSKLITLYLQMRKHTANLDIDEAFLMVGINFNLTSSAQRESYLLDE